MTILERQLPSTNDHPRKAAAQSVFINQPILPRVTLVRQLPNLYHQPILLRITLGSQLPVHRLCLLDLPSNGVTNSRRRNPKVICMGGFR